MCDGSITTMVSNQSRMSYCWIVYCTIYLFFLEKNILLKSCEKISMLNILIFLSAANSQSNERLSATESRSSAIASSSSNARTLMGQATNQTTFRSPPKPSKDTFDDKNDQKNLPSTNGGGVDDDDLASVHLMLEPHLRPPPPDPKSDISKQIFDEHKQLAKEYLKVILILFNIFHIFTDDFKF